MVICNGLGKPIKVKRQPEKEKEPSLLTYDLVVALIISLLFYSIGVILV